MAPSALWPTALCRLFCSSKSHVLEQSLTQSRGYAKNGRSNYIRFSFLISHFLFFFFFFFFFFLTGMDIALPAFTSTSSSELDAKLKRFREDLFLPFSLNIRQRGLMSRKRYARRLEQEQVTVTIGKNHDEQFTLRYMDPKKRPKKAEAVETLSLMKTKEDWENLVPFLAGLRLARQELRPPRWQWLIRRAGLADRLGLILECAKQSERTGLRLTDVDIVRQLFLQLHLAAYRAQFQEPVLSKVLGLSKQFVELMQMPGHVVHDPQLDPKRRPFVIGVLLELSAARGVNASQGVNDDGAAVVDEALAYAQRLCSTWSLGDYTSSVERWPEADRLLGENIPIANGVQTALKIPRVQKEEEVYHTLQTNLKQLKEQIETLTQAVPEKVQQKPTLGYSSLDLISS